MANNTIPKWVAGLTIRGRIGLNETIRLSNVAVTSVESLEALIEQKFLRFENGVCYFGEVHSPYIGKKGWQEILTFIMKQNNKEL